MAGKFTVLPEFVSLQNYAALRKLLEDDKANEMLERLIELRDEINASIATVGKAQEIEALNVQAVQDRKEAAIALAQAKSNAQEIIAKAKSDAEVLDAQTTTALAEAQRLKETREQELAQAHADEEKRTAVWDAKDANQTAREAKIVAAEKANKEQAAALAELQKKLDSIFKK